MKLGMAVMTAFLAMKVQVMMRAPVSSQVAQQIHPLCPTLVRLRKRKRSPRINRNPHKRKIPKNYKYGNAYTWLQYENNDTNFFNF